jgi:hypothetical protein
MFDGTADENQPPNVNARADSADPGTQKDD